MYKEPTSMKQDQQGFAAIIVTVIIVGILSLITIGFVSVMGREQRQTQDRQLSTQAFYAAEAGINDAIKAIEDGHYATGKSDCGPDSIITDNKIDDVEWTCLLIQPQPYDLEYGSVGNSTPIVTPIEPIDSSGAAATIDKLQISWEGEAELGGTFASPLVSGSTTHFPRNWNSGATALNTGVLRINLVPQNITSRDEAKDRSFTAFLYPSRATTVASRLQAGNIVYATSQGVTGQGRIIGGNCHNDKKTSGTFPKFCSVEISGLPTSQFALAMRSIYKTSKVTIRAYDGAGNLLRLKNAQTAIDSTGKATDVLRRVAVRVPKNSYAFPGFVMETVEEMCKQYGVLPPIGISAATSNCSD